LADTPDIRRYFDTLAQDWNKNYSKSILFSERLEKIKKLTFSIQLENKNVLDIGCGSGMISAYFCEKGSSVFGIDISENMIHQADDFVRSRNFKATFTIGDATKLQFPDNYFDLISCISVIEWLDNDAGALSEIKRVLKKDGFAVVSVPNQSSWFRKLEKGIFRVKSLISPFLKVNPGYLSFQKHQYDPDVFDELCKKNHLIKTESLFYVSPFPRFNFFRKLAAYRQFGMIYFVKLQKSGD
jgi:ubiquinone/menaquinone biosynthesis C-methylase UbiE